MFGDRLDETLARGRAAAQARMRSTARVRRDNGLTTGPDGWDVVDWLDVYDGPFEQKGGTNGDGGSRGVTVGGVTYETATGIGAFPAEQRNFRPGDIYEITSGPWVGEFFRIIAQPMKDFDTARRVPVEAVARPEGW